MQNVNFQSGDKITKQVLAYEVSAVDASILSRISDIYQAGVVSGLLNGMQFIVGSNSSGASPTITISTGVAYNANGERILISDQTVPFNSSNPSVTTPDGIGGNTNTPQSTGSLNIALTANTTNFIWVDYVLGLDPLAFTIHKVTKQKLFYKNLDGYKLGVNASSSTPPAGFSSASILLGYVQTNSTIINGIATISYASRPAFGANASNIKIHTPKIDRSDATLTYSYNETLLLDDHIKAFGTGVITPTNPHGLAPVDLGILDVSEHQRLLHTNGIISPSIGGNASALYMQVHTSGIASENFVEILPLTVNELIVVDGITVDSVNIPNTVQFSFIDTNGNPLPDGVYTFYVDSNDRSVDMANPGDFNTGDLTLQRIWTVQWTSPTLDSTSIRDYRLFGTLTGENIRFELLGALDTGLATGNRSITFSYDNSGNLIQMGVGGENGTIAGSITLITFSYSGNQLVQIGSEWGNRQLLTTLTYSGTTLTEVTEQVI